ncbi:D-glycero-beta-D-manno-heptose-7-phosphate kinase [Mucilaginibacter lacusdianchii]|uniref:D-glycero-beta-D-manno-heptose-7-phosphate kinase n=1 Tax=Mucilaginibacter lacusdianchii TaxID=2684211 RepID=UPI00131C59B5|nr:D-glycero-beta-D-manno-heptose-7-phosphate kinase [Mucilaginibacter sp. JXJ CY 39]
MLLDKVRALRQSPKQPDILVIGDLMIDHYVWGDATRLSPEAPVPVVNIKSETTTLGGAANVAQNLISLGAKVTLAGVIGDDISGGQLTTILEQEGIDTCAIVKDASRPTTVKTRVLAGSHQLVRVDREVTDPVSEAMEDEMLEKLNACIAKSDIILFSDYNKGLFSPSLSQKLIKAAVEHQKKVIVDPKGLNYAKYKGAHIIKPNRKELTEAAKVEKIKTTGDLREASKIIFDQTGIDYLVVTLSEEGMAIVSELTYKMLPVKATEVFDVTGAGDTVLAAMAYFMATGFNLEEACELANHAAAIVIRRVGSATTSVDEIINDMVRNG